MEPVLGAGGVIPPHESFMPMVREICDRHGILLIADEVITGFGRTGAMSGSRLWNVKPDMMTIAKAITNGYFPFGAALIGEKVAEAFENDNSSFGFIGSGYTYSAHPVGAAAALACLPEIAKANIVDNAAARGAELKAGLEMLKEKHVLVGDVRGQGLMAAIEFVSDRKTKAPAGLDVMSAFFEATYAAGVMVRISGHNALMSPPLIITSDDVAKIIAAYDVGLKAALAV
jgi:adenosylmethionine-8-amino-7-oxononanoate aminotransferase